MAQTMRAAVVRQFRMPLVVKEYPYPLLDRTRITVRGSNVGTRQDLEQSLQFAAEGKQARSTAVSS